MRQALADALVAFEGALLVISHDRTMLRSVVDSLILIADRKVTSFDDDLDGYARWLATRRNESAGLSEDSNNSGNRAGSGSRGDTSGLPKTGSGGSAAIAGSVDRKQQKRLEAERRAMLAPLTQAVTKHERALDKATDRLAQLRTELASEELYNEDQKARLAELLDAETSARRNVEAAEEQLLLSMESLEQARHNHAN